PLQPGDANGGPGRRGHRGRASPAATPECRAAAMPPRSPARARRAVRTPAGNARQSTIPTIRADAGRCGDPSKEHRLAISPERLLHGGADLVERRIRARGVQNERDEIRLRARRGTQSVDTLLPARRITRPPQGSEPFALFALRLFSHLQ